jgi:hypothetical protein
MGEHLLVNLEESGEVEVEHGFCWTPFPNVVINGQSLDDPQEIEIVLITFIYDWW